jgi:Ca2+-binding RTX toxin-like protein
MASIVKRGNTGSKILDAITANKIWGEKTLQYLIGDDKVLDLDPEHEKAFHKEFTGDPDQFFVFGATLDKAYNALASVSKLNITVTTDETVADLVVVSSPNPKDETLEGFFQFPGNASHEKNDYWSIGGFNSASTSLNAGAEKGGGSYVNWTIFHEVGHSMGLKHTHQEKKGQPALPEIGPMDDEKYSVMSYDPATDNADSYGHAVTYMALDIAALQAIYGKDNYADGNSVYGIYDPGQHDLDLSEGKLAIGRAYACIWDTSGMDVICYFGALSDVIINLNSATLNTDKLSGGLKQIINTVEGTSYFNGLSGQQQRAMTDPKLVAGGFFSQVLGEDGGFSIAHGVVIENGYGGDGDDLIIGNLAGNFLYGGGGEDTIVGGGGKDTLYGGEGKDILIGGAGADKFMYSGDNDVIKDFNPGEGDEKVGDWPS